MLTRFIYLFALVIATGSALASELNATTKQAPQIEVCFVLDTTGSMSNLIAGAKKKIWYIANEIARAQPTPDLKFCLIGFRDRGDDYVTRHFDLTDDIDSIYDKLKQFSADGGGDTPESVNQALYESIANTSWSSNPAVMKTVFLVGDAPPHMDYPNDIKYPQITKMALSSDVVINTIQCGNHKQTTPIWKDIASSAYGRFSRIAQGGNVQVIHTPMDQDMVALNIKIGQTLVPYGNKQRRQQTRLKQSSSEAGLESVASDRLSYNNRTGKVIQGGGDLIEDIDNGKATLADIKDADLPASLQAKTLAEKQTYLTQQKQDREELQLIVSKLIEERDNYIATKKKKRGNKDAFDEEVVTMIHEQAKRIGIHYE